VVKLYHKEKTREVKSYFNKRGEEMGQSIKKFGEFVREKRLEINMTLREFCRKTGVDASNWSKVERSIKKPPKSKEVLEPIADILELDGEEYNTLYDLATISHVPKETLTDEKILESLPILFRTARQGPPSRKDMEELYEMIMKGETDEDN